MLEPAAGILNEVARSLARAVALGLGCALCLGPAAALAHANLVRSEPPSSANLEQSPGQVQLWFSERPEPKLSEIQIFNQQQQRVDRGPAQAAGDPQSLIEPLRPDLPQGVYTVSWRTTSAIDGHSTGGAFAFGVGVAPPAVDLSATLGAQDAGPNWASAAIRWASYLSSVGLLGLILFATLITDSPSSPAGVEQDGVRRRLARSGRALAGLMFLATLAMILFQAADSSSGGFSLEGLQATIATDLGHILIARLVLAAAIMAGLLASVRAMVPGSTHRSLGAAAARPMQAQSAAALNLERTAVLAALLADLLLFALSSHAQTVANAPELALLVDWLHLVTAGTWVGGLIALAVCVIPELGSRLKPGAPTGAGDVQLNQAFGPLVTAFSRVAFVSAIGLAVTGFYQALVHIGSFEDALGTDYGHAVIIKTALFALALLLAAFHRWMLLPELADPTRSTATRARRFFSRTLPLEAVPAIAILLVAGVLMTLSPANNLEASGLAQSKSLGDTRVVLEIVPLRIGPNLFQVNLSSRGRPVSDAQKVELQFTMLDMDMGQSVIDLDSRGNGVYSAQDDVLSMGGRWRVDLLLRLPGQLDQRASFDFTTKP